MAAVRRSRRSVASWATWARSRLQRESHGPVRRFLGQASGVGVSAASPGRLLRRPGRRWIVWRPPASARLPERGARPARGGPRAGARGCGPTPVALRMAVPMARVGSRNPQVASARRFPRERGGTVAGGAFASLPRRCSGRAPSCARFPVPGSRASPRT